MKNKVGDGKSIPRTTQQGWSALLDLQVYDIELDSSPNLAQGDNGKALLDCQGKKSHPLTFNISLAHSKFWDAHRLLNLLVYGTA